MEIPTAGSAPSTRRASDGRQIVLAEVNPAACDSGDVDAVVYEEKRSPGSGGFLGSLSGPKEIGIRQILLANLDGPNSLFEKDPGDVFRAFEAAAASVRDRVDGRKPADAQFPPEINLSMKRVVNRPS